MTSTDVDPVLHHHPRLLGLAYRMLGDMDDAEDVVQEAMVRWHERERPEVVSPEGWLVTVVSRLAIDRLRRAATERAAYIGPWLPEPIATTPPAPTDRAAELSSDLSIALLLLLERLAPEERVAFLLRDVFNAEYGEIAATLERSEPAVRQMVHRARDRVHTDRARFTVSIERHRELLDRFVAAIVADDQAALLALLAPDVTFTSDGGGKVAAARKPVAGADHVSRLLFGLARKAWGQLTSASGFVNGQPALLFYYGEALFSVMTVAVDGDRISDIFNVLNPSKLRRASHVTTELE